MAYLISRKAVSIPQRIAYSFFISCNGNSDLLKEVTIVSYSPDESSNLSIRIVILQGLSNSQDTYFFSLPDFDGPAIHFARPLLKSSTSFLLWVVLNSTVLSTSSSIIGSFFVSVE